MAWRGRRVLSRRGDELAPAQALEGALHGALGKAGGVGEVTQACNHWLPFLAHGLPI